MGLCWRKLTVSETRIGIWLGNKMDKARSNVTGDPNDDKVVLQKF